MLESAVLLYNLQLEFNVQIVLYIFWKNYQTKISEVCIWDVCPSSVKVMLNLSNNECTTMKSQGSKHSDQLKL